mmetsp:Transcript_8293/g.24411  ORF Transcript_8293/g.24411 Transcript_8293/m.24411 type:complete len:249 (+) Transcript_8293:844-1590(+)
MPLVQCTLFGAFRCRILYVNLLLFRNPSNGSSLAPLWLISTRSGTSVNFNQQSPAVCTCASGSKHTSLAMSHQTNALHGRSLNGPPPLPGTCSRHFCAHCSAVAALCPIPHLTANPSYEAYFSIHAICSNLLVSARSNSIFVVEFTRHVGSTCAYPSIAGDPHSLFLVSCPTGKLGSFFFTSTNFVFSLSSISCIFLTPFASIFALFAYGPIVPLVHTTLSPFAIVPGSTSSYTCFCFFNQHFFVSGL